MITKKRKTHLTFFYLTASLICMVFLFPLLRPGMWQDGILYAAIAKNMAHGIGNIWSPYFNRYHWSHFYEHPSLGLWMESIYFRLLGDGFLSERIFILTETLVTTLGLVILWKRSFSKLDINYLMWVPIFLLFTNFLIMKVLGRNLLDPIVMCFSLYAAIFIIENSIFGISNRYFRLLMAAALMTIGFLANGLQVFFPLAIPCISSLIRKDISFKLALWYTGVLIIGILLLLSVIFYLQPAALNDIKQYFLLQVIPSTIGNRSVALYTGIGRLHVLLYPLFPCALGILFCAYFWLTGLIKHPKFSFSQSKKTALFYGVIALAASLPVAIAHRQDNNYIVQSLPFFILAMAQFITPGFAHVLDKFSNLSFFTQRILYYTSLLMMVASFIIVLIFFGTPHRDKDMIHDVHIIGAYISPAANILNKDRAGSIYVSRYFERYEGVNVTFDHQTRYLFTLKTDAVPKGYKLVSLNTKKYNLYIKE